MRFFNSNNLDKITAEQGQQIIISCKYWAEN
jgi:hypothetical protein